MSDSSNFLKNRTRSTFFTSLISISLVLFFLGLFATVALYSHQLLKEIQEEFEMMVLLEDDLSAEKVSKLKTKLETSPYVKEVRFISKKEAAADFMETAGDDFLAIMDSINPMRASFNCKLRVAYMDADSIKQINKSLVALAEVAEIDYPMTEISQIRKNINRYLAIAGGIGLIIILIAYFIISGTVRLAIFSSRLMIRSMTLIGATNSFIRRPFLLMGLAQGFSGGMVAVILLCALIWFGPKAWPQLKGVENLLTSPGFMFLSLGIIIFGSLLGLLSSGLAVNRFLNKQLDQLI